MISAAAQVRAPAGVPKDERQPAKQPPAIATFRSGPKYDAEMASSAYQQGPRAPGSSKERPGPAPSPGPYGPNPPGRPGTPGSPGERPVYPPGRPLTQPYGGGGGPGGPGGYPPGPGSEGSGNKLVSIIAGAVVLVGVAVGVGFLISGRGEPGSPTSSPSGFSSAVSPPGQSPTSIASPQQAPSGSPSASSSPAQKLPSSAAIPQSEVIVPMRFDAGPDRPLYLVDTEGKVNQVELPSPDGGNSNPIMQASRNTIIYANSGVLRVMAADGSGDRKLFNRDPAGCARVEHASWSLTDPNVILLTCELSKGKFGLLVVGLDGGLIRRLNAGKKVIGDAGISPDGQTVLYWASDNSDQGGAIYTLPIIGTGEPKPLTNSAAGVDADPAWSPDGTQIAFRRKVLAGNEDIFVMNADGSGVRAVATTPAADFKPIWSPDSKNLLIISNRKSAFGGPGSTFDLWLTRATDGEILTNLDLKAKQITRPFWTQR